MTNPRVYRSPTPIDVALAFADRLLQSPSLVVLAETDGHWEHLRALVKTGAVGSAIRDAKIAAICLQHGVRELWTADRDFSRFPD